MQERTLMRVAAILFSVFLIAAQATALPAPYYFIDHIHDAEDKGQPDPDQRIGATDDQAIDDILEENHMQLGRKFSQILADKDLKPIACSGHAVVGLSGI